MSHYNQQPFDQEDDGWRRSPGDMDNGYASQAEANELRQKLRDAAKAYAAKLTDIVAEYDLAGWDDVNEQELATETYEQAVEYYVFDQWIAEKCKDGTKAFQGAGLMWEVE